CNSASASTPLASASFARGLSSELKSRVSPGSMSLRRNLFPFETRNGSVNCLARSITSFFFILTHKLLIEISHLPAAAKCLVDLHDGQQFIAPCLGQAQLGVK